jgi:hypothetical protein
MRALDTINLTGSGLPMDSMFPAGSSATRK